MPSAALTDDNYHSLAELLGLRGSNARFMTEGFLDAVSNGLTFRYGDETVPGATVAGAQVSAGAARGFGPVSREAAWDIQRLWVRNTTAGSNATVVLNARLVV